MRGLGLPRDVRILVFGAGAIGSLLGGVLSRDNHVTIVGKSSHVEAVNRNGLRITGHTNFVAHPTATTQVPSGEFDIVAVTTKSYDTGAAIEALQALWGRSTFVTLQNGLGNAERIALHAARVLAGTTSHGVTFLAPGEIHHAGRGEIAVGPWKNTTMEDAHRFARTLALAGLEANAVVDASVELWSKVVVNAAINPLTAVLRVRNGALVESEDLHALVSAIAREAVAAANVAGVRLSAQKLVDRALEVASKTADNRSSMLQDVERGRRTETDAITGELLRVANMAGLDVPFIRALDALVRGLERVQLAPR